MRIFTQNFESHAAYREEMLSGIESGVEKDALLFKQWDDGTITATIRIATTAELVRWYGPERDLEVAG